MKSAYTVVFSHQRHHQHSQFGISEGANQQVITVLELYRVSIGQHNQDGSQSTLPFVSNLHQHDLPHQLLVARLVWSTLRCLILWTAFFLLRLWVTETVTAGDAEVWHQYRPIQQNTSTVIWNTNTPNFPPKQASWPYLCQELNGLHSLK